MFPMPATTRWSTSASPDEARLSTARNRGRRARRSRSPARTDRARAREACPRPSERTGPVPLRRLPLASAEHEPRRAGDESRDSRRATRQRPFIRRWLRTTTPPSKCRSRFLPTASTRSRTRPSTARATPVARPRGFGLSASSRSPTSTCSRCAVRWSESPSGTSAAERRSSSRSALKIASENVGYGWIVSRRTSIGHLGADRERQLTEPLPRLGADRDGSDEHALLAVGRELDESRSLRPLVRREPPARRSRSAP